MCVCVCVCVCVFSAYVANKRLLLSYFCTYAFEPAPNANIGMEIYHFQPSPITYGPDPNLDKICRDKKSLSLSPLYVIVVPGSCSIGFSSSRRPEKSTILIGLSLTAVFGRLKMKYIQAPSQALRQSVI